ncbi:hypothetical protein CGCA056_v004484 [Colletotrichum aenigma]|uniref:uncharacterized protein n=1 Tax=Colletotrichum aenigma TaxID=1215731 RepID=UPI0018726FAA|nr:uncharacterized protein CGCA056_v004484 [Colletotrichum aenigma]KAF5523346.1 hypothetical protein CGCA056_v004484 [Colletotrichum aenigma]
MQQVSRSGEWSVGELTLQFKIWSQATLETGGVRTRKGSQDGVDNGAAVQFSPGDDLSEIRGQGKKKGMVVQESCPELWVVSD